MDLGMEQSPAYVKTRVKKIDNFQSDKKMRDCPYPESFHFLIFDELEGTYIKWLWFDEELPYRIQQGSTSKKNSSKIVHFQLLF